MSTVIVRRAGTPRRPGAARAARSCSSPRRRYRKSVRRRLQQMLMYLPMLAPWRSAWSPSSLSGTGSGALRWVGGGAMALGMGGMVLGQMARGKGDRKLKLNGLRRDYLRYLGQVAAQGPPGRGRSSGRHWSGAGPEPGALQLADYRQRARPAVGTAAGGRRLRQRPARHRHAARSRCGWCRRRPSRSRTSTRCAPARCAGSSGPMAR